MRLGDAFKAAEQMLGERPERVAAFQPPAGGDDSHSFRLWAGGRPLFLKVMIRAGVPVGAYFHARLQEAGVPVPGLIAFSADAGPGGAGCGIFEWIDGTPAEFSSHERPPYDEVEFGRLLRRIHALRHDRGFGRLDESGRTSHLCWRDWLSDGVEWVCARCRERGALAEGLTDRLHGLTDRYTEEIAAAPPALLHYGDIMHNGNIIVDAASGAIQAVVDFSDAIVGDPRLELAWVEVYFGAYGYFGHGFDLRRFRRGYGDDIDADDPLRPVYVALVLLTMLTYVDPGSERGCHHRRLVEELLLVR